MADRQIVRCHVGSIARGIDFANAQPDQEGLASVNPIFTWLRLAQRIPRASTSIKCRMACIPLFLKVPGAITGRRFRAQHREPAYVAFRHVEDTSVYATHA
jgi:hypothetical protein